MDDVAGFLRDHAPFGDLDPATVDRLAARVAVEHFSAGTTIFEQGERSQDAVRLIRRGTVELVDHGRVLDLLGEGELFGHPSMVSGLPTGFEARAHDDALCYAIAAQDAVPLLTGPTGLRYLTRALLERPRPRPLGAADTNVYELAQQPVRALIREQPVICDPDVSLREAAARMVDAGSSSVLVKLDGDAFGIVTDHDLRSRVVAKGLSVDTPVRAAMTAPVVTIGAERSGADALMVMLDRGIRHLPLVSPGAEVVGVISDMDLLAAEARNPFVLRRAIDEARDVDGLRRAAGRLDPTVIALHRAGLAPAQMTAVIAVVVDALIRRTIEFAASSLGTPPAGFAWLSLGSHGRREAVPSSDLDSGLVWAGGGEADPAPDLHALADEVLGTLRSTGWESDPHGVTAAGSIVADSIAGWERKLTHWLDHPERETVLMALSIVLDHRVVYGPTDAFGALATLKAVRQRPRVGRLLLRLALAQKPPTGFMRNIVVEHSGEHRGSFDVKRTGLVPIVGIARYAGHAAGATATSTVERLRAAAAGGTLGHIEAGTLEEAYGLLTRLRLEHQVEQLESGVPPDNHLDPKALNPLMRRYLRDAFRAVAAVQKGLDRELMWMH